MFSKLFNLEIYLDCIIYHVLLDEKNIFNRIRNLKYFHSKKSCFKMYFMNSRKYVKKNQNR